MKAKTKAKTRYTEYWVLDDDGASCYEAASLKDARAGLAEQRALARGSYRDPLEIYRLTCLVPCRGGYSRRKLKPRHAY
jgi:hypothetical protein